MKSIVSSLAILSFLVLFFSCSKELSLEDGGVPSNELLDWQFDDSLGTHKGKVDTAYRYAQGNLEALTIEGTNSEGDHRIYLQFIGEPLRIGQYVSDSASFAYFRGAELIYFSDPSVGGFTITVEQLDSSFVSGIFSGTVVDARTGLREVRNGKFKANVGSEPLGGTSEGALVCDGLTVNGEYFSGTQTDATNYIEFPVHITKPGTFFISSSLENGLQFAGQGEFSDTGSYTIQLGAAGTPDSTGSSSFTITYGNTTCNFTIDVQAASDTLLDPPFGLLSSEERVEGTPATETMKYNVIQKIAEIQATGNPIRRIKYDVDGKIKYMEFWLPDGLGGIFLQNRVKFDYGANGNVIAINLVDDADAFIDTLFTYAYRTDNRLTSKTIFNNGDPVKRVDYVYTGNNITTVNFTDAGLSNYVDSLRFQYDTRANRFPAIHSQFYFIDMANVYDQGNKNEVFYFSENYPIMMKDKNNADTPIDVIINPSFNPIEIRFNGRVQFRYFY